MRDQRLKKKEQCGVKTGVGKVCIRSALRFGESIVQMLGGMRRVCCVVRLGILTARVSIRGGV